MRYAFITEDIYPWGDWMIPGGCAYYRMMLPKNTVGDAGVFGPPAWTAQQGFGVVSNNTFAKFGFDTVMMKMMMARWVPMQMQQAKKLGQRLIVDVDDAFDHLHEDNMAYHTTHPDKNRVHNREHLWNVLREADLVTVSTPFLYDYYKDQLERVVMVRNGINPKQFTARKHQNRKPTIGWVGAMGWRSQDIETLREWLPDFVEQHDLLVYHGGHEDRYGSFADVSGVNPERVVVAPMMPLTRYHELMQFDIGLVPLSFIPFNEAKSNIKGLEYAASNIPFVAAGTGEYRHLASRGVGRVANSPDEWVQHVTELLDYNVRKKEAARQRELVLRNESIIARAPEWVDVFGQFADHQSDVRSTVRAYVHS